MVNINPQGYKKNAFNIATPFLEFELEAQSDLQATLLLKRVNFVNDAAEAYACTSESTMMEYIIIYSMGRSSQSSSIHKV